MILSLDVFQNMLAGLQDAHEQHPDDVQEVWLRENNIPEETYMKLSEVAGVYVAEFLSQQEEKGYGWNEERVVDEKELIVLGSAIAAANFILGWEAAKLCLTTPSERDSDE